MFENRYYMFRNEAETLKGDENIQNQLEGCKRNKTVYMKKFHNQCLRLDLKSQLINVERREKVEK